MTQTMMKTMTEPINTDTETEEAALAIKAKEGNMDAFSALVSRYTYTLRIYIQSICTNATDAEDICQECLRKAYQNIGGYNPAFQFRTWIFSIAKNTAIDHLRKKNSFTTVKLGETDEPAEEDRELDISPEDSLIGEQSYDLLVKSIAALPEKYRQPAELRMLHDYTYQDIADELDIPLNTVRTRLRRARLMLEETMRK